MSYKPTLLNFKFANFSNLPSDVDNAVYSEIKTDSNGNKWSLRLFPGGQRSAKKEGWVALYLINENGKEIECKLRFSVKDKERTIVGDRNWNQFKQFSQAQQTKHAWGFDLFMKRSKILDSANNILKDDTLSIDVTIQVKEDNKNLYQPPNEHLDKMLNLLESGKQSDVTFEVGRKKIPAHSVILVNNAPIFASFINQQKPGSDVVIRNTEPEVFKMILQHIYAGRIPAIDVAIKMGKELIDAANRYELVTLKMAVENILVQERILDTKNVANYIVFADAQSCPLLKEYAISYFLLHAKEVLKSEHSKCLRESSELLSEMLMLVADGDEDEETVTVTELRKELGKRKLDVDGSKEALVSRLREAKRQKTD